jgi:hypothetical protein
MLSLYQSPINYRSSNIEENFTQEETAITVTVVAWNLYSYLKGNEEMAKLLK